MKINLMPTFLLMKRVAQIEALKPIIISKPQLNIGIKNENMGNVQQVPFINAIEDRKIKITKYDEGTSVTEKGASDVENFKDFYMGEPL